MGSPSIDSAEQRQALVATTSTVPVNERIAYWKQVVSDCLLDVDFEQVGSGTFHAKMTGAVLGMLSLTRIDASPHVAQRVCERAVHDGEAILFNFVIEGSVLAEQDGRTLRINPRDGAFFESRTAYRLWSVEPFSIACIRVPRACLERHISGLHRLSSINLCGRSQLGPLLYGYVAQLLDTAPTLDAAHGVKVSQHFIDLLVSVIADVSEADPLPLSEYRSLALIRVKDIVESNLDDAGLSAATISAKLKLTPRYINQLLAAENTSLVRYIWHRRLDRTHSSCATQLSAGARSPRSRSRTGSTILVISAKRFVSASTCHRASIGRRVIAA